MLGEAEEKSENNKSLKVKTKWINVIKIIVIFFVILPCLFLFFCFAGFGLAFSGKSIAPLAICVTIVGLIFLKLAANLIHKLSYERRLDSNRNQIKSKIPIAHKIISCLGYLVFLFPSGENRQKDKDTRKSIDNLHFYFCLLFTLLKSRSPFKFY